ncbi:MAG TPA: hypothetical protein VJ755_08680 [Gemmatimonadales bacterium]|nr:hypothetical protein [Gemmatimonadales bacterium]
MSRYELLSLMAVVAGFVIILYPLARAIAERIRPRPLDPGVREELQALRDDLLGELQQTRREIGDLNERIDFTERLLVKKSEQR